MKKPIIYEGNETNYEVSDDGKIFNKITKKELKGTYKTNEYHSIQLVINGRPKTFMVHRLVAQAFCDNPNNYTIVDHINRDKTDDRALNLRWASASENALNVSAFNRSKSTKYFTEDFNEDWKEVRNYPGYMINKNTALVVNKKTKRILAINDRHGYKRVDLCDARYHSLHLLVWETFVGKVKEGYEIDHIDGDKSNNSLSNLREVSHEDNMRNAYKNGHNNAVKVYLFDLNGQFIKKFDSMNEAAAAMNCFEPAIKDASLRKGTCCGYYWLRENEKDDIQKIINSWIPEGYKIIPSHPTYCINKERKIYNKRNKTLCSTYYLLDDITEMIMIKSRRYKVEDLYNETFNKEP